LSWRNDSFFDGQDVWTRKLPDKRRTIYGTQPPVRDTDSTFIECMGNRYIRKSHLRTGRQLWESPVKLKTAPALYDAYPPLLLNADSSRLYIADKGKIHAISTVTGESVWAKEPKLKRPVLDYTLTDAGLLVMIGRQSAPGKRSDPEVLLLSADTGEDIWHETARDMSIEDLTNLAADGDRAWVYSRKRLFGIGLTDGAIVEIANDVDFRGAGEKPLILTAHDGSFWLRSAENVMEVDESGTIVHHAHYPGQQISDLEFIGKFLAGAAIQLTLGQVFTGAWQWDWIFEGSLPIKARYIQQVDNRFTSHYVVSRNPEVAQLTEIVRLDRGTFRETGRARLTTKVDVLSIDEDRSLVVFVHDDTHLMCTRFLAP
ncbi:MAG: PQQ-binding-like beta-propeller repeat protein, partial [candidate division Zixibacteria bacterium]|nr:PQQ-binding-like beta-propeller repeat protein [candidate division Zixibacteria bacterium]